MTTTEPTLFGANSPANANGLFIYGDSPKVQLSAEFGPYCAEITSTADRRRLADAISAALNGTRRQDIMMESAHKDNRIWAVALGDEYVHIEATTCTMHDGTPAWDASGEGAQAMMTLPEAREALAALRQAI